jgi:diguanylate cyclase (GGDEF)-like protein/PAS domain S-box-containing protein
MQKSALSTARVAGLAVGLLGVTLAVRWVFQVDVIARIFPGSEHVGIVDPLLFVAASICLFNASRPSSPAAWLTRLSAICIAALIALPLAYLFEGATRIGLGVDIVRAGTVATATLPSPGRLSANASLAFLLSGIGFWLNRQPSTRPRQLVFLALSLAVFIIGLAGLVGHFVGLETLYRVASFNRILPVTALGLSVVGAGLWMLHEASQAFEPKALQKTEQRIKRRSIAVITLVALAGGVAGFGVMRDTFERSVAKDMLLIARTNATSLAHTIEVSLWFPRTVATRPAARQALDTLSTAPDDALAKEFLQRVADSVLTTDLTGVEIYAANATRVAQAGSMTSAKTQVIQRLSNTGSTTSLAWREGYLLLTATDVRVGERTVGRVLTEQRMPLFDRLLVDIRASGDTSDVAICGRDQDRLVCAPNRFRPSGFELPMFDAAGSPALPVARAVLGEQGVQFLEDRRGKHVLSAFAPIKDFGLGLAVRTDVETLYAPMRSRLNLLALALVGIVALAIYVQHSEVRPVLRQLVASVSAAEAAEQAVRASEHRLRMVTDHLPALISYLDCDLRFRFVNRTYQQWFGDAAAPQIGASVREFYGEQAWVEVEPLLREALGGHEVAYDREMVRPEGRRHVQVTAVPDRDERGVVVGLYTLVADVTSYREAQRALQESEARLRTVADALPMRVAYIDADERYRFNNLAYERGFGRPRDEIHGQTVRALLGDAAYRTIEPHIRAALRGEAVTFQSEMSNGSSHVCYEAQYIPQLAANGSTVLGFHAVVSDITRQKLEEKRLIELARVDPLTGLVNRAGFELRVAEAMERCRTTGALMALMYLDIDRFKQINDRYGHNAGDAVLREFADRLSRTLRFSDTVARLGGDEFTAIMEGLPAPEMASSVAAKIVHAMRTPFVIDHQTIDVTTSIGLAFYQGDATTVEALVKQADVMLYQAKGAGRNNVQVALRLVEGGGA